MRQKFKKSKYHATKTIIDGIAFDSRKEAKRYQELKLLEKAGMVTDLELQKKFVLIPSQKIDGKVVERECSYVADFVYKENGYLIVEDVKGVKTKEYILKRKMMLYLKGIRIKET